MHGIAKQSFIRVHLVGFMLADNGEFGEPTGHAFTRTLCAGTKGNDHFRAETKAHIVAHGRRRFTENHLRRHLVFHDHFRGRAGE